MRASKISHVPRVLKQIGISVNAGVPLPKVLNLMSQNEPLYGLKSELKELESDCKNGVPLQIAINKIIPKPYRLLSKESAQVPDVVPFLNDLADTYDLTMKEGKRVANSLWYPIFLIVCIEALFLVWMAWGQTISPLTRALMLGVGLGLFPIVGILMRQIMDIAKGRTPGSCLLVLSLFLKQGVSIKRAAESICFSDKRLQSKWQKIKEGSLESGNTISQFCNHFNLSPLDSQTLLSLEAHPSFPTKCAEFARQLLKKEIWQIEQRTRLLKPILLLVIGIMILVLALSIYAPLIEQIQVI